MENQNEATCVVLSREELFDCLFKIYSYICDVSFRDTIMA